MKSVFFFLAGIVGAFSMAFTFTGCGSDGGGGANISSLSQLPDTSSMITTNTEATSLSSFFAKYYPDVSGTAPLLKDLSSSNVDTYFWDGLVADIAAELGAEPPALADPTDAGRFWGQVVGGPGGNGACFMAQNTAQVFGRLLESSGSACYMKSMPTAASGVSVTPTPDGGAANLFNQQSSDFLVKVNVTGDVEEQGGGEGGGGGGGGDGTMTVFITIHGTDTVTSDVYKATLYFCQEGEVNGVESFELNKTTGLYTATSEHSDRGTFTSTTSGYVKEGSDGTFIFDTTKDRTTTMNGSFSGDGGTDSFRGEMTITSDNLIYSKMVHSNDHGSDRNSAVAQFSGTSAEDVRFLAAGFSGRSEYGEYDAHEFSGAVEFRDTYYAAITPSSSDLYTAASAVDLDGTFFTVSEPDVSFAGLDCNATPSYTVDMDFGDSAVAAIRTSCDGKHAVRSGDYCWSGAVQTTQGLLQQYCQGGGECSFQ